MPPPRLDPPPQVCVRCSKPITPGTASQYASRPVHMRCLAADTRVDAIEQQDSAALAHWRAKAARARADELIDTIRRQQTTCPVCRQPLATSRGVLFQGDQLVHAGCWGEPPKTLDQPPPPE